jgi:hypothetical protein
MVSCAVVEDDPLDDDNVDDTELREDDAPRLGVGRGRTRSEVGGSLLLLALGTARLSGIASRGTRCAGVPLRSTRTHAIASPTLNPTSTYSC